LRGLAEGLKTSQLKEKKLRKKAKRLEREKKEADEATQQQYDSFMKVREEDIQAMRQLEMQLTNAVNAHSQLSMEFSRYKEQHEEKLSMARKELEEVKGML